MPGAIIVADQLSGAGAGVVGLARNDLWLGQSIQLTSTAGGNPGPFLWELLAAPPGSAVALATPATSIATFTPDLIGTYRIRLTVNGGGPGNVQTLVFRVRYDSSGAQAGRGWAYPAFGEVGAESNYGSNVRGWAEPLESILEDIRTHAFGGGVTSANFVQPTVGATVSVTLLTTLGLVVGQIDFIQGGGYYQVASITSGIVAVLTSLGYPGDASPGTTITAGAAVSVSGPRGPAGTAGTNGTNGKNGFTTLNASFVQPASGANVSATLVDTSSLAVGEPIFIATGGSYAVVSVDSGTTATITNLGYPANASPGATVTRGSAVVPSGVQGATAAPSLSPNRLILFAGVATDNTGSYRRVSSFRFNLSEVSPAPTHVKLSVQLETDNAAAAALVQLYDLTLNSVVTGGSVTTNAISATNLLTADLTFPSANHVYELQLRTGTATNNARMSGAWLEFS